MAPVFFTAEWDHSRVKWRHSRERASGTPLVRHMSFTVIITTLTILLCKWCSELQQFTGWKISPHLFSLFHHGYYFVFVGFLPAFFEVLPDKLVARHPQHTCCCIPLEQLAVSLQGQLVLVSGVLYNRHVRGFPPLWKFSFHSETSFSLCWHSVENACLPSEGGWVLLSSLSDWRHMQISQGESCMEQHLLN